MERARYNTEPYSNQSPPPNNNVKPSNFWGSHHSGNSCFLFVNTTELSFYHCTCHYVGNQCPESYNTALVGRMYPVGEQDDRGL